MQEIVCCSEEGVNTIPPVVYLKLFLNARHRFFSFNRRYFIDNVAMTSHFKTKGHKRRLKELETEPYTAAESERAAGKGNFFEPKKRKVETQPLNQKRIKIDQT